MSKPNWHSVRLVLGGALAGAAVLVVLLLLQDARQGWPFSRHPAAADSPVAAAHSPVASGPAAARASRATVAIDPLQLERLGIQFEPARVEPLTLTSRAVATIAADERRLSHVHTRVSGWVERLYVNTTGEPVRAGQPLAAVFSQELFASQNEYLAAARQKADLPESMVLNAARTRLAVLGMSDREIEALEREGAARRLITIDAPRSGVVLRRGVTVGTAVDPGTELFTVADLSHVWVIAELPEGDAGSIGVGTPATLSFPGSGREPFPAAVEFVYPTLAERTRAVRVRFTVANADGRLRPGLYGAATFAAVSRPALTVARDAVVDTGLSQHVFVRTASGALEPRSVRLGARLAERMEVLDGLTAGELVAASGVFLIDSESRLRASGGGGHAGHGTRAPADTDQRPQHQAMPTEESGAEHAEHGPPP